MPEEFHHLHSMRYEPQTVYRPHMLLPWIIAGELLAENIRFATKLFSASHQRTPLR